MYQFSASDDVRQVSDSPSHKHISKVDDICSLDRRDLRDVSMEQPDSTDYSLIILRMTPYISGPIPLAIVIVPRAFTFETMLTMQ